MVMAFLIWLLDLVGVSPSPEDFERMKRDFSARGHHVALDLATTRFDGTRWTGQHFRNLPTIGLGYEYLVLRKYNGVGVELQAESTGELIHAIGAEHQFFLGGGLAWYPIQPLRVFMHGGPRIRDDGAVDVLGRVGVGYRLMFFAIGVQPYVSVQTTTTGVTTWTLGGRFEY